MAPEILNGSEYGLAADVFSFALLMFEVTVHHRPYLDMESEVAIMAKVLRGERETIPPGCPMGPIIERCWVEDPTKRPTFVQLVPLLEDVFSSAK